MQFDRGKFRGAYQMAMAQQTPKAYQELKQAGLLDEHLEEATESAVTLFNQIMGNLKISEGRIDEGSAMRAGEIVYHEMIQFSE